MSTTPKQYNFGDVPDKSGRNRLTLFYIGNIDQDKECGYNFHSLVWSVSDNEIWQKYLTISEKEFDSDPKLLKWISEIHSFDSETGSAILKIAEGDAPRDSESINYIYSWREWDLVNNIEISYLQKCEDPFEKYHE
jgi:hypothetical protein